LLGDAGQIPSSFGTRAGCLVVLDKGGEEVLLAVDRAGKKSFEPVESLAAHHDWKVGCDDVVVAVGSCNTLILNFSIC